MTSVNKLKEWNMSSYKKRNKKEQHDFATEAKEWSEHVIHWLMINWKKITMVVIAFAVVISGGFGLNYYIDRQEYKAALNLYKLDRTEADVVAKLQALIKQDSKTTAGQLALLELAGAYAEKEQNDKAKETLEKLKKQTGGQGLIAVSASYQLAQIAFESGDFKSAKSKFHEAALLPGNFVKEEGLYFAAIAAEQLNEYEVAGQFYAQVLASDAQRLGQLKSLAKGRLLSLALADKYQLKK